MPLLGHDGLDKDRNTFLPCKGVAPRSVCSPIGFCMFRYESRSRQVGTGLAVGLIAQILLPLVAGQVAGKAGTSLQDQIPRTP